ncbi:hypothetical protein BGW36DRAFT_465243 [Talaromyces proteolyticus]|uniref:BZIP domain-containing protein n=1 Tax=Talaromyces proteolyticus TaxID=1131652 RepID=A0AAD4KMR3_9EURO|nr:uncharacterized protein BGW36DRAFT_465243 [Talaromyces proteolyticus]KAH8691515.1 hypothetical protein BGW36DRAFT_465243 [Talaromyces proteolyticus]
MSESYSEANVAERRRLQNRLSQRASRTRKAKQALLAGVARRPRGRPRKTDLDKDNDLLPVEKANEPAVNGPHVIQSAVISTQIFQDASSKSDITQSRNLSICSCDAAEMLQLIGRLSIGVYHGMHTDADPSADMLFSLTQFNVLRAMYTNISLLGLTMDDIKSDMVSTFSCSNIQDLKPPSSLPPSLAPTQLQKSIIHHPWIDPFPLPTFRDTLLLASGLYDEEELCNDLVGQCGGGQGQVGIIIWGQPWDPHAWEMSEKFARKWHWLFGGCQELLDSTNYWRSQRGEPSMSSVYGFNIAPAEVIWRPRSSSSL